MTPDPHFFDTPFRHVLAYLESEFPNFLIDYEHTTLPHYFETKNSKIDLQLDREIRNLQKSIFFQNKLLKHTFSVMYSRIEVASNTERVREHLYVQYITSIRSKYESK